ncbi:PQQ-binding-like beta-propeller repeat protein [Bremerella sp.]|uniref:outer membrane protein assembly factor BamB family protein n=1 Tax=Bremerella sp. TaxID=2795602 RepID=UPI00391DD783
MKTQAIKRTILGLIIAISLSAAISAQDWPHWRGPNRDDHVSIESGWNGKQWPLKEAWSASVGEGSTTPIVAGRQLITMGYADDKETIVSLDLASGKALWSQSYPAPRYGRYAIGDKGLYFGPTSSPEFDPETKFVYTLGCDGELACWDTADQGREVWRKNLYDTYQMKERPGEGERNRNQRDYGYICAPLVYGNWLLVETGGNAGTVLAFDKRSGQQLWASKHKDFAGHSGSPVVMTVEGVPCLALLTFREFLVIRLDEGHAGETVGTYPWPSAYANNLLTPTLLAEGQVILSSWHSFGERSNPMTHLVQVTLNGIEKQWEQPVSSHLCSPVVAQGRIYIAGPELYCLDGKSGAVIWKGASYNYGASCVLTGDDRLVVLGNRGKLRLIETQGHQQQTYQELSLRSTLTRDDIWSHVVLAHDMLICKDVAGRISALRIER